MLARTITIVAGRGLLRPGTTRLSPEAFIPAIIAATPRATYAEALSDGDGTFTVLPFEMLPRLFGIDPAAEDPAVVDELTGFYQGYISTKAEGQVQARLNGNNRSMLVDIPTTRDGQKFRSARFITEDPPGVLRLNQTRISRMVAAARAANNLRVLSFTRQPELAGQLNAMFAQGLSDVAALMAPMPEPNLALGSGNPAS